MSVLTRDIALHLVDQGQATGLGVDAFLEGWPQTPAECLCLTDTGGYAVPPGLADTARTVQVGVRHGSVAAAKAWAWAVFNVLSPDPDSGSRCVTFDSGRKAVLVAQTPPYPLGRDEADLSRYVFNLVVTTGRDSPDES